MKNLALAMGIILAISAFLGTFLFPPSERGFGTKPQQRISEERKESAIPIFRTPLMPRFQCENEINMYRYKGMSAKQKKEFVDSCVKQLSALEVDIPDLRK